MVTSDKNNNSIKAVVEVNTDKSDQKHHSLSKTQPRGLVLRIEILAILIPLLVGLISGTYYLGKDMGSAKFDSDKNKLYDSVLILHKQVEKANGLFQTYLDSIEIIQAEKGVEIALTHDKQAIPAWEVLKKKIHSKH
jgi:hypothetical protein